MNKAYQQAQLAKRIKAKYPFVKIGNQYWTSKNFAETSTVLGTPIREMQPNANVEKLANINFATNATWIPTGGVWTIGGGIATMVANGSDASIYQTPAITVGKWHKITITVSSYTSGSLYAIYLGIGNFFPINITSAGTFTYYVYATGSGFVQIKALTFNGSLSLFSCQEIGWSGSQELYDGIYAQTAGTAEQKTYAAVKASGWWCDYNNLATNGLIYGHLYNWFAVKLIQMDIDYYNAALLATYGNTPEYYTRRYIWKIPTEQNFIDLSNTLGGNAVSGGKLKKEGTAFWNSPNTGADNSSGFSILGCGQRVVTGIYQSIGQISPIWSIDKKMYYLLNTGGSLTEYLDFNISGNCIRQIRA